MLGIIIGVAAVIITISAGEGATKQVRDQISELGTNLLMISPKTERRGGIVVRMGRPLIKSDFDLLKKNTVWMRHLSPVIALGIQAVGPDGYKPSTIYGVSGDYFAILNKEVVLGNPFSEEDVLAATKVCVIGHELREELFAGQDPIGRQIQIDKVPLIIVGVLKEIGQGAMGQEQDNIVIAPYTTVQNRLFGSRRYSMIVASATTENNVPDAKLEAIMLLREAHRLLPNQEDDFQIMTQIELQEITGNITGILTILLGAIASISLLVGGIGIMNIMLVLVTERTREIGTRLAIGARESDILFQFLTESVVLSLTGGVLGIILGITGNLIIYKTTNFYIPVVAYSILIGFGFSALVGIAFGFFPARKAAKLNPIDALRYE